MLYFLDVGYVKKIQVLYFINDAQNPVSINEIANYTGSTWKTIQVLLLALRKDIESFSFDLVETKEKKYFLVSNNSNQSIYFDDYLLMCGKNSLVFAIVEELFYKESINTIEFCNDRYISQATFSRGKKKLRDILLKSNLKLPTYVKKGIVGNEYKIRLFYFYFFYSFYNSIEWPFEESAMNDINNNFYSKFEKIVGPISNINKRKFCILAYIIKKRISQRHFIKKDMISFEGLKVYSPVYDLFNSFFKKNIYIDEDTIKKEVNFFIYGLYSNEIIDIDKRDLLPIIKKDKQVTELTNTWILEFKQTVIYSLSNEDELLLFYKLSRLHLRYRYNYFPNKLFSKYELFDTDLEKYNEWIYIKTKKMYKNIIKYDVYIKFLNNYLSNNERNELFENYYYYIYSYFLSLEKLKPITIYIDDSIGKIDKKILKKRLELVFGDNIIIKEIENGDIELILTSSVYKIDEIEREKVFYYRNDKSFFKFTEIIQKKIYIQLSKNRKLKEHIYED
ncbi:helix-turn-helix domain-containing protein [Carnobacterium maltaromaticum]|uniref:helix-turn-helix domain-containing protein n=1 Tax=Carnobacterium maltaromaticum TaxID=2751 RepID=UPI0018CDE8AF|nr:helix-turn-helix domain-containing protein [Carnobacterium maltaromaticum]